MQWYLCAPWCSRTVPLIINLSDAHISTPYQYNYIRLERNLTHIDMEARKCRFSKIATWPLQYHMGTWPRLRHAISRRTQVRDRQVRIVFRIIIKI